MSVGWEASPAFAAPSASSGQAKRHPDATARPEPVEGARCPNILWIITDDHRADAIQAWNRATTERDYSPLGYVMSPAADKLAAWVLRQAGISGTG